MNLAQLQARLGQLGVRPKDVNRAALYIDYLNHAETYFTTTLAGTVPPGLGNDYPFVADALGSASLLQQLADLLDFYVAPAVEADLHRAYAPVPGGLGHGGATGWTYQDYFTNLILDANPVTFTNNVQAFRARYPISADALQLLSVNFEGNILLSCQRVIADRALLTNFYRDLYEEDFAILSLQKIKSTGSDFHKGGKQVLILTFEIVHTVDYGPPILFAPTREQLKVVYKPSDLEADCLIVGQSAVVNRVLGIPFMVASLFEIYNTRLQTMKTANPAFTGEALTTYRILPRNYMSAYAGGAPLPIRNAYGYIEYLDNDLSGTAQQVYGYYPFGASDYLIFQSQSKNDIARSFYRQEGALAALCGSFSLIDMHIENVRVRKYKPYLIDLEISLTSVINNILSTALLGDNGGITGISISGQDSTWVVHKAADPGQADLIRAYPTVYYQNRLWFAAANRRKRTIAVSRRYLLQGFTDGMTVLRTCQQNNDFQAWFARLNNVLVRYLPYETSDFKAIRTKIFFTTLAGTNPGAALIPTLATALRSFLSQQYDTFVQTGNPAAEPNFVSLTQTVCGPDYLNLDIPVFYHRIGTTTIVDSRGADVPIPQAVAVDDPGQIPPSGRPPSSVAAASSTATPSLPTRQCRPTSSKGRSRFWPAPALPPGKPCSGEPSSAAWAATPPIQHPRLSASMLEDDILSTIDLIISRIESLPIDGDALTLKASDFDGGFMASFFSKLLLAESITFSDARRTPGSETITVSGSATVLGYTGLSCALTFDVQDNEVVGTIVGTFAKTKTIPLPLITWIKLGNIVISTSISETFELVGLDFKMDILLDNGDVIPVELQRQSNTEWRLDIAEGTDQGITGEGIVALLGGQSLESFVPEPLSKILEGFKINDIETILDTQQKTVSYFSLGVSVTNGWDIAPKVSLKPGLQVGLTLINPTDKDSRATVGNLSATFDLAGVIVPITIGATIGSVSSWTFGLQPGQSVTLPSFSNLLELAGGDDFFATLPSGLSKIPKIDVDKLMIEFEPDKKELTLLSFSLQTDSSWPVIANYFEIQKLKIAFDITDLTNSATRAVLGDLYALFLVDKIALMCEIKKTQENPDWTITAGLAPGQTINFTNVVTGLFEGKVKPPDDVPQIIFDVLAITVIPDKKSFEFKAGSSSDWWIIANKMAIASFDLDFTRAEANSVSTITGHIASTLKLKTSGIELNLKASLNDTPGGGWQFSGSTGTAPIPIGTLIGDLAGIFGDFTPPPILTGLSVSKLAVTFNTKSKDFTFTCTLQDSELPDLLVAVDIGFTHTGTDTFTKKFSGTAHYKSTKFVLDFEVDFVEAKDPKSKTSTTIAKYNAQTPPTLSDFLELVGTELGFDADFPKELNLDADLKSLTLQLVKKDQDPLRIEAAGLFELKFGSDKPWDLYLSYTNDSYFESAGSTSRAEDSTGKPAYIFGISFSGILDLTKLPLVGSIPGVGDFSIDKLGFYYTDATFTTTDKKLIFGVAELGTKTPLAPDPASAFLSQPKFSLMALFRDPKDTSGASAANAMPLGTATSTPPANTAPAFATKQADPRQPISWLPIDKTIGPVDLSKVGLSYESPGKGDSCELGIVGIYFDGAFSIAGLTMVLDRLGITFPIPMPGGTIDNPLSKVGFHLGGMFLEYKAPDIEIAGGFINLPGESVNMIGEFVVEAGPYGLQAYGGYTPTRLDTLRSSFSCT